MPQQTPSQTVGPFFHLGLISGGENDIVSEGTQGRRIMIEGAVLDGDGKPVSDAMVESWQADANGIYNHPADPRYAEIDPHFEGFARAATDAAGRYWIRTVMPGPIEREDMSPQPPHVNMRVFARGMLIHATSRLYFEGEPGNEDDQLLNSIEDPARRQTLIAALESGEELPTYRFNFILQGEGETVFLDP